MRDLDAHETYHPDKSRLHEDLRNLADTPVALAEVYPGPYGVVGFGEGWWPAELAREWIPAALVQEGTQFVLQGGYDLGEAMGAGLFAEAGGARVVRIGFGDGTDVEIPPHPLAAYRYLQHLLHATGQHTEAEKVRQAVAREKEHLVPEVPTEQNPAKLTAWNLVERTPVWVVSDRYPDLARAAQQVFARVAKSLSISPPPAGLEFFITALEARHEQGDPLVAVVLGDDERTRLAVEILGTRVDTIVELPPPQADGLLAETMAYWYRLAWVSYYLALMYGQDPGDQEVLSRLRDAT